MENGIMVFEDSRFGRLRIVWRGDEPRFVANDVCECLGVTNARDALAKMLDEDEKGVETVYTPGGPQEMLVVSEPGFYSLVLRSRKPEAKAFKRWVTHEVLPSIRKTGGYSVPSVAGQHVDTRLYTQVAASREIFAAAGLVGNQLTLAMDKIYRKAFGLSAIEGAGIDLVADRQEQLFSITDLGRMVIPKMSAAALNKLMERFGYHEKVGGKWQPTESGRAVGYTLVDTGKLNGGTPVMQPKAPRSILRHLGDNIRVVDQQ